MHFDGVLEFNPVTFEVYIIRLVGGLAGLS
jgi:hypothetical protein